MVSVREKYLFINGGDQDMSRPKERPSKTNWKIAMVKKGVGALQYVSPKLASNIVWYYFTKPGRSRFTEKQQQLVDKAVISTTSYFGHKLTTYRWGEEGPRVLLSHGWNSKIADYRRIIEKLVDDGYVVEGIDMKAHGKSDGTHTALPEIRDILKNYYVQSGPFHAVIGYSIGGLAAGIMLSELSAEFQPKKFFLIAAPSHTTYFFREVVSDLGYSDAVFSEMCRRVEVEYFQHIDYFDLRSKTQNLSGVELHLVYDQDDQTVPFDRGAELNGTFTESYFVETKGLGHYKVLTHPEVIGYIGEAMI